MTLTRTIARYDQVLLDLDGCLWVGEEALEGAPEAVAALREAGKAVAFLTNDVRHAPEEFVRKLWRLGFQAALSEVVTVGSVVQYLLSERDGGAAYVVGSLALVDHVAEAGMRIVNRTEFASRADVVVVGAHEAFGYDELKIATQAVLRGAELIGATRDATFPMPDGPWPASGAVLAAIEVAAGRQADLVAGKPEPPMYEAARDRLGEGRCLAVGDRLEIDVLGARRAGMDSALVLTGGTTRAQADAALARTSDTTPAQADAALARTSDTTPAQADAAELRPTHVADSLAALVLG